MSFDRLDQITLALMMALPLLLALRHTREQSVTSFVAHSGGVRLWPVTASVVAGNIGIGTFVAIYAFAQASALVGLAIVFAFSSGLLACSVLAPQIRRFARRTGTTSLVDAIIVSHGITSIWLVWLPVAGVFLLRCVVQIIALSVIVQGVFGLGVVQATALSTAVSGIYVAVGGYRAATQTDMVQAVIILAGCLLAVGQLLIEGSVRMPQTLDLGPYRPVLLVGIVFLLPFGAILTVNNWQRITTAESDALASRAFLIASLVCLCVFLVIYLLATRVEAGPDVVMTFRNSMPFGAAWVADMVLVAAIMSSIDTLFMPNITTFARRGLSVAQLRLVIVALFVVLGLVALMIGDVLDSIIAAFGSLVVFLPVVAGGALLKGPRPAAALLSVWSGVTVTLVAQSIDVNSAGVIGFLTALVSYAALHWRGRRAMTPP